MKNLDLIALLRGNPYPGRGIVLGSSPDGEKSVIAYFIMGRSENSRNRVFVETPDGIRTQAFDPSKMTDPSLIIYAPVRVFGTSTIRHQRRPDRHHPGLPEKRPAHGTGPAHPGI